MKIKYPKESQMKILGYIPDPYIEVIDKCPFCYNPKRRYTKQSHPRYEGFYDMECGFCHKTPRKESKKTEHSISLMKTDNVTW